MTDWQAPAQTGWPEQPSPQVATEVTVEAAPALQLTQEEKNSLIQTWLSAKHNATTAVETEKGVRENLTAALFPNAKKGTQRYVSPEGFGSIKLVYGWTYTLGDRDKIDASSGLKVPVKDQVDAVLTRIEGLGERGVLLADRLVKWKPELVVSEYELLAGSDNPDDATAKAWIDEILTVKPASPQVSFEPPKVKE